MPWWAENTPADRVVMVTACHVSRRSPTLCVFYGCVQKFVCLYVSALSTLCICMCNQVFDNDGVINISESGFIGQVSLHKQGI